MIDIKDKNGNVRVSVEITEQCVYYKSLMSEEYVLLYFESDAVIPFAKGDYIDTEFGTFKIVYLTTPTRTSSGGYQYEQKFYPSWENLRNRLTFYDRQQGSEKSWKMTQTPEYFLSVIAGNIEKAGFGKYTWEVDAELTDMKLVEFDATNILDALTKVAEAWETEWWITDNVIHLSRCEFGSPVDLEVGDAITEVESSASQENTYITRLYAFGSTRNLPKNYRKDGEGAAVIEGVVETRLKLPIGVSCVDAYPNIATEDIVEGVAVFEDVYPSQTGTIDTITTKQYTDKIENEDGTTTTEQWNAFRFTDAGITFSNDYRLNDEELRIVFQSGKLAGMDFAVNFNPDGIAETEKEAQVFEIVRNEDYGVPLPSDDFKPSVGDTYVLYGYDTKYVNDKLVEKAENELLDKAKDYVAKWSKPNETWTCPTNPIRCAGYSEGADGALNYDSNAEIDLEVGQVVTLHDDCTFAEGSKTSRVFGFEKKLDNKFNTTYTIGESDVYSKRKELSEKVEELTHITNKITNVYGSSVYVVKRYDKTAPTDSNVLSSKRSQYEFLNRNMPDRATEEIRFEKGIALGKNFTELGFDGAGAGKILSAIVKKFMASEDFVDGFGGRGWKVWLDEHGLSNLTLDNLTVRRVMTIFQLVIAQVKSIGGQFVLSAANAKAIKVEELEDGWKVYFQKTDNEGTYVYNQFQVGDGAQCSTFNTMAQDGGQLTHYYWRRVTDVSDNTNQDEQLHWIVLSKTDCGAGSDAPLEGDEIVQLGNKTDVDRQGAIILAAAGAGSPFIRLYEGITDFVFPKPVIDLSPSNVDITADSISLKSEGGEKVDIATRLDNILDTISTVADQIDESFQVWKSEENVTPTLKNEPASEWKTDTDKASHINDYFVNSEGFVWQFMFDGGAYKWISVSDELLIKAAQLATEKVRNFITQPTDAAKYDVGDIWVNATYPTDGSMYSNDTLVCIFGKEAGEPFQISDWQLSSKYTDDTRADEAFELATQTTSELNIEKGKLEAFTQKVTFDADGDITNISKNGLVTTENYAALFTEEKDKNGLATKSEVQTSVEGVKAVTDKISFDAAGNVTNISKSGLVLTEDYATLFAEQKDAEGLATKAEVKTEVQDGISKATIQADQVNFIGKTIINDKFIVNENGDVELSNATVKGTIEANSGIIGGMNIKGNSLTNEGLDNDASIILANRNAGTFAGIGGSVNSITTGIKAVARFENNEVHSTGQLGYNVAMIVEATNANTNAAIYCSGGQFAGLNLKTQYESGSATIDADTNVVVISGATAFINLNLPKMKDVYDGRMLTILNISSYGGYIIAGENEDSEYNNCINWVDGATYPKVNLNKSRHICRLIYCAKQGFLVNGTTYHGTWIAL